MHLPLAALPANAVVYKMRSRNVLTERSQSDQFRTCQPLENRFRSPAFATTFARWFRGTGGIDTPLSTHGYFSPPAETDGRRSVAGNVSAFRRTGRPSTNRPAA